MKFCGGEDASSCVNVGNATDTRLLIAILGAILLAFWTDGAIAGTTAVRVLGQPDFLHAGTNNVTASGLNLTFSSTLIAVAVDTTSTPNHAYVADIGNNRVLGYSNVSSLGNGQPADLVVGQPDFETSSCGSVCSPQGLAVDSNGNLYVSDTPHNRVLIFHSPFAALTATGQNSGFNPFMVLGQGGSFSATSCNVSGSSPDAETLCGPTGVAVDSGNNLYVTDTGNQRVLEFNNPVGTQKLLANLVFGQPTFTSNPTTGTSATSFSNPLGLALDGSGNLYVADFSNSRVLEFNTPLTATSTPGSGDTIADKVFGQGGSFTTASCSAPSASSLCDPVAVALDTQNNLYVADFLRNRVLEYNTPLTATSTPGSGDTTADLVFGQASNFTSGSCNLGSNSPAASSLCIPGGVALDSAGDLFTTDRNDSRVLVYRTPLTTDTIADVVLGQVDFVHSGTNRINGQGFAQPVAMALDRSTAPNHLYVADLNNFRVLGWNNAASFSNNASADLVIGQPDFVSNSFSGVSSIGRPGGLAVDGSGNLYVADPNFNRVLEFNTPFAACASLPCVGGPPKTVFGQNGSFTSSSCNLGSSNGSPSASTLCSPGSVAVDPTGNLFIADSANNRVLEYNTPLQASSEPNSGDTVADLVFGQGASGNTFTTSGCASTISATSLCNPEGLSVDPSGTLYVIDANDGNRVLGFTESAQPPGNVTANIVFGQGGSFTQASFCAAHDTSTLCRASGVGTDPAGNVFIADTFSNRMLLFPTPFASNPIASVVWGQGGDFFAASCNVGGSAPDALTLCTPQAVAIDSSSNVLIADTGNNRVLQYVPPYTPPGNNSKRPPPSRGSVALQKSLLRVGLGFGAIAPGNTSQSKRVVLANNGPVPVTIREVSVSSDFTQTNNCGGVLAAGATCTVRVAFRPASVDRRKGYLTFSDDAQGSPQSVELRGIGKRGPHPQ